MSKFTKDLECVAKFSTNLCDFLGLIFGKTIGSVKMSVGLYLLQAKVPRDPINRDYILRACLFFLFISVLYPTWIAFPDIQ